MQQLAFFAWNVLWDMHNVSIIVVIGFRDETKKVGEYPTRTYMTALDLYGSDDSLSDYDLNVTIELNQDLSNAELGNLWSY